MRKYRIIQYNFLALLLILAVWSLGCGGNKQEEIKAKEAVPVEAAPVMLGSIVKSLDYTGDIKAEYEVKVFSKIPDRIEKFFFDEGNYIKQGDIIARVVATTIEQGVRQTEAMLTSAQVQESNLRVEFDRAERLFRENAMSKQQYDGIKTQYESLKAQVGQAQAALITSKSQLDDAAVTAPISGIIGKRYYDDGDMANPSLPLVTIVKMDRIKILFNAAEEELGKLAVGQKASIKVWAYPDRQFEGSVHKISPILDPDTRMAEIEVFVDNPNNLLKPGMYAQIKVIYGTLDNVIVIPRNVTIENTTMEKVKGSNQVVRNYYVYIIDGGIARQKKLDVIFENHESVAVSSGIKVGDTLVISGQNSLRDSVVVSIVKN